MDSATIASWELAAMRGTTTQNAGACLGRSHAPPQPNVSHGTSYRYVPRQLRTIHTICCDLLRPIRVIWHTRFPSLVSVSKMGHIHVVLSSTELVRAPRISPLVAFMSEWSIVLYSSPIRNRQLIIRSIN